MYRDTDSYAQQNMGFSGLSRGFIAALALLLSTNTLAAPEKLFTGNTQQAKPGKHATMAIRGKVSVGALKKQPNSLLVELPDGSTAELQQTRFNKKSGDRATWRGKAKGAKKSQATIAVRGNHMAGRLQIDDDVYLISPAGENEVTIEWLDMTSFPDYTDDTRIVELDEVAGREVVAPAPATAALDAAAPQMDLLVLYDDAALAAAGSVAAMETVVDAAVATINSSFQNSGVTVTVSLAHTALRSHSATSLSTYLSWLRNDSTTASLRNLHNADLVSMITGSTTGGCGIGYVQQTLSSDFADFAFQVTDYDCAVGNLTFAHETGHNMGMEHDPANGSDPADALRPFAFGHFVSSSFRTVMSYSNQCTGSCTRVSQFSNPDISYRGSATGIATERDNSAIADLTAPSIALYRGPATIGSGGNDFPILHPYDDGQEQDSSGAVTLGWPDHWSGSYSFNEFDETTIGLRFQGVDVPRNAYITDAWLEFTASANSSGSSSSTISVEAADDAAPFTGATNDFSGRTLGSSVAWNSIPTWTNGNRYQSVDISSLVQDIVDRNGWENYQSMAFFQHDTTGDRHSDAFEVGVPTAPSLHVEYRVCDENTTLLGGTTWQMISLPCVPDDNTVLDIFPTLNSAEYGTTWAVFSHNASSGSYTRLLETDTMTGNQGYWFVTTGSSLSLDVTGKESRTTEISLYSDSDPDAGSYNMIGHTGLDNIPWDEVVIVDEGAGTEHSLAAADPIVGSDFACDTGTPAVNGCLMSRVMHKWNGSAYVPYNGTDAGSIGSADKFESLWVKAYKPGLKLRIPKTAVGSSTDASRAGRSTEDGGWTMRLTVRSDGRLDDGNIIGQAADALDGKDYHDMAELKPYGSQYLSLTFVNDELGETSWGYTTDYRSISKKPSGEWRFRVRSSGTTGEAATLTWDAPDEITRKGYLEDETTGETFPLKKIQQHDFLLEGGERYFRLYLR